MHLHYVLIGGAVFPLFGAFNYWFPKLGAFTIALSVLMDVSVVGGPMARPDYRQESGRGIFPLCSSSGSVWRSRLLPTALAKARREFLPQVATGTGAFFSAVVAAQWVAVPLISPCTS